MISQDGKPGQIISPNPRYRHNLLIIIKGGGRMCHILKPKLKVKGTQIKKRVTGLRFCMAVAL